MTVRVDELTTDVTVEGETPAPPAGQPARRRHSGRGSRRCGRCSERVARDAARTSAEDYGD